MSSKGQSSSFFLLSSSLTGCIATLLLTVNNSSELPSVVSPGSFHSSWWIVALIWLDLLSIWSHCSLWQLWCSFYRLLWYFWPFLTFFSIFFVIVNILSVYLDTSWDLKPQGYSICLTPMFDWSVLGEYLGCWLFFGFSGLFSMYFGFLNILSMYSDTSWAERP